MNQKIVSVMPKILALVVLLSLVAACGAAPEPTAVPTTRPAGLTPVPTDMPVEPTPVPTTEQVEPTPQPTAEPPPPEPTPPEATPETYSGDTDKLMANLWQWERFTDPLQQFDVEDPQRYAVAFLPDGTLQVKADCNNAGGSYTATEGGELAVELGAMTKAMCPPESRSDEFVKNLGAAARYFFIKDRLYIDLFADGGTMEFAPGQGGTDEKPTIGPEALTADPWQWERFTDPLQQFDVEDAASYIVAFQPDGSLRIKADCNSASGSYTAMEDGELSIDVGAMTRAMCRPESRSDEFVKNLGAAARYFFIKDRLYIDLFADGGTMEFGAAEAAAGAAPIPEALAAELRDFLQAQIYAGDSDPAETVPGAILLVDTPQGRFLEAAGVSSMETGAPMQVADLLEIGSASKSFAVVLLLQLQEEGVLSLDDTLDRWLPEQAAGIPHGPQMTLRELAQHTAGIYDYGQELIGAAALDDDLLVRGYAPEELVQWAIDHGQPYFAPGKADQWLYSNTGYILLGMVLEQATGQAMGELLQARIFDRLDMSSAMLIEGVPEPGDITNGYYWIGDRWRDNTRWNASQGWAAGALAMDAGDLAAYVKALAAGELFQDPETLEEMLHFHLFPEGYAELLGMDGYALGLERYGQDAYGHSGQTAGFESFWMVVPEEEITIVALVNSASFSAKKFEEVRGLLLGGVTGGGTVHGQEILAANPWQWVRLHDTGLQFDVAVPEVYVVSFQPDGTMQIKADCNAATGSYTVGPDRSLSVEIGTRTMALCAPESRGAEYLQYLTEAAHFYFQDENLYVDLEVEGGMMEFEPAAAEAASP